MIEVTPATAMTHWMKLEIILAGSVQELAAQFSEKLTPRAIRNVLRMTVASMTIARPIKACERVFFAIAILLGSPEENV